MALYSCTRFWIFNFRWDELPRYVVYGVALKIILCMWPIYSTTMSLFFVLKMVREFFFLRQDVAGVAVEKLDYPADKMTHLLHG